MKRVNVLTRTPITNLRSTNRILVGDVKGVKLSDDDIKRCLRTGARVTVLEDLSAPVEAVVDREQDVTPPQEKGDVTGDETILTGDVEDEETTEESEDVLSTEEVTTTEDDSVEEFEVMQLTSTEEDDTTVDEIIDTAETTTSTEEVTAVDYSRKHGRKKR